MSVLTPVVDTWDGVNRRIYLKQGVSDYYPIEDIYHEYRNARRLIEDLRKFEPLLKAEGNVPKGAGAFTPRYVVLLDGTKIIPYDEALQLNQLGDIITDDPDTDPSLYDISGLTTAKPIFIKPSEAETIQLNAESMVFSSFQGAAWYKAGSPYGDKGSATEPNGNTERPVNDPALAIEIAHERGLLEIRVLGDLDTNDVTHDFTDLHLVGVSHINSHLNMGSDTICTRTRFSQFDMTGTLDGESEIRNCIVRNLTYFNGHIHDSYLVGRITLAGDKNANIESCRVLDFDNPPIIDAGGSGQDLAMPNFSGIMYIDNLTGNSKFGIGVDAGQVIVNPTCTAGLVQIGGTGSIVDESGPDCYVVDSIINGTDVQNLSRIIELQRPHHTGTGNVWFWDPYGGNDTWDGKHANRGTKTFAQAQNLATDNGHDIVVCVAGDPSGNTITNENIVITKNYLFLRGPGRDFRIHSLLDDTNAIEILANGVEVSSLELSSEQTSTASVIRSSGNFPLLKDLYIDDAGSGIHITDGEFGIIENTRVTHGTGYAIRVDGASNHFTISDSHIAEYSGNGVEIDLVGGSEVVINKGTVIHGCGGYGITTSVTTTGVLLGGDINVYENGIAPIQDLASDTQFTQLVKAARQANYVWAASLTENNTAGTFGGELATKTDIKASATLSISLADSATIIEGTDTSGSYTDTFVRDNVFWIINESLAGLTVEYAFTIPENNRSSVVSVYGHYDGKGSSHYLDLWAWNTESLSWELLKANFMTNKTEDQDQIQEYNEQHIDRTTNEVKIRLVHNVTTYAVTHDLHLDAIALASIEVTTATEIATAVWENIKGSEVHASQMHKRHTDEANKEITLYEEDNSTPKKVFDYVENSNGEIITITPQ